MKLFTKKGIALETAVILIVVVVVFIILLPFVWKLVMYALAYAKGGTCGTSAALSSLRYEKACFDIAESPVALRCSRRHITFEENKVSLLNNGKEQTYSIYDPDSERSYNHYDELTVEAVWSVLADELVGCWAQFNNGESVLLDQAAISRAFFRDTRDRTACFVCSEIYFETQEPSPAIDLRKYLVQNSPKNSRLSYFDLLNNDKAICEKFLTEGERHKSCWEELEFYYTSPFKEVKKRYGETRLGVNNFDNWLLSGKLNDVDRMQNIKGLTINENKNLAVVYVRKRFDTCQKNEQDTSNYELSNFVYILPQERINGLCDAIVS